MTGIPQMYSEKEVVMYWSDVFYALTLFLFVVSLIASGVVRHRFKVYSQEQTQNGMTGARAAETILRSNHIMDVQIAQAPGTLTDNYNPTSRVLNLSEAVYRRNSVAAVAVAAHECSHAIAGTDICVITCKNQRFKYFRLCVHAGKHYMLFSHFLNINRYSHTNFCYKI